MSKTTISHKSVNLSESDLENWLEENPEALVIPSHGSITEWYGRQLQVPSGIIDLIGITESETVCVVELKNKLPDASALTQVSRYASDVLDILNRVPGVNVYVDILKVIVYNGEKITNQLQFEADALDVHLFSFDVKLKAEVNGPWSFTKEYRETLSKIYDDAGQTHPFSEMAEYFKVHGDDPGVEAEFSVNGSTPEGADVSREVEDDQG